MVPCEALKQADAKRFIGATDRAWRKLLRDGTLKPNRVGSFNVSDLRALIQNETDEATTGRQVRENQEDPGGQDLGIRSDARRSRRRSKAQAIHPLDALIQSKQGDAA